MYPHNSLFVSGNLANDRLHSHHSKSLMCVGKCSWNWLTTLFPSFNSHKLGWSPSSSGPHCQSMLVRLASNPITSHSIPMKSPCLPDKSLVLRPEIRLRLPEGDPLKEGDSTPERSLGGPPGWFRSKSENQTDLGWFGGYDFGNLHWNTEVLLHNYSIWTERERESRRWEIGWKGYHPKS